MTSVHPYVFDANAIISALLFPESIPGQTFFGALERGQVLMSRDLAEELSEVLTRSKFDRYLTREERERLLVAVIDEAEFSLPCNFDRGGLSELQSFANVQAPPLARHPGCSYRSASHRAAGPFDQIKLPRPGPSRLLTRAESAA